MYFMRKVLGQTFFDRDTTIVAKELLGKFLVRKEGDKEIAVIITETEAYDGLQDRASHAFKGRTPRTEVMFGAPGIFYVYLCYGMYYLLNIVTREASYPAAVLIRGGVGDNALLNGPGKLTRFLNINAAMNRQRAVKASGLWFEDRGIIIQPSAIKKTARIGVAYAKSPWALKKLRFVWQWS